MYDVAVLIINYNTARYTLECVEAVKAQTSSDVSYQIIVVDNASETLDFHTLQTHFPKAENCSLHRSIINTGFGGGNMYAAQFANASYLLFLNNDAVLLNNSLSILKKYMDKHLAVGVCTAQNYNEHDKAVPSFDHNKGLRRLLLGRGYLEKTNPKRYPKRKYNHTTPIIVDWVNGAYLFFRKEAFEKIGGFDTHIFLYWEEMDIGERLRKNNYQSVLVPAAKVKHFQGASTGVNKQIAKESYRSYLYVVRKHYGKFKFFITTVYLLVVLSLKPKKWYLLPTIYSGGTLTQSLKNKQKAQYI